MAGAALDCMRIAFVMAMAMAMCCVHAENATTTTDAATTRANATAGIDFQGFGDVADHAAPIVGLVYGPVFCFFGFAWYAHIVQVVGFLLGGMLFSLGAFLMVQSYSSLAIAFLIVSFLCGGCLVGAIMGLRPAVCTFAIGGSVGIALTYAVFFFAGLQLNNDESPILLLAGTVLMIMIGAIFVRFERPSIIIFSSVFGSYGWIYGVGYFAGKFPTWRMIYDHFSDKDDESGAGSAMPWAWWVYASAFVVLVAWSLWEQCRTRKERERVTKRETETRAFDDSDDALVTSPSTDGTRLPEASYYMHCA